MTDYATSAELKSYLRIPADDTEDDAELALAITAASRSIDRHTNRTFTPNTAAAAARYFTASWDGSRYVVAIPDLMTTTDLAVAGDDGTGAFATAYTASDYALGPVNAASDGLPWTRLVFATGVSAPTGTEWVRVTAKWGWTAVPSTVKLAALVQASRLFKRRDAPFGIAGSAEMGSELRLFAKLDPDVEMMVGDYRRWWAAA